MYLYLVLNIGIIFVPLLLTFEKRVRFYSFFRETLFSIFSVGTIFIIWDILAVRRGHWKFNPEYISGVELFNLPIEEIFFFITVPYACIFIYQCMVYYVEKKVLRIPPFPFQLAAIIMMLFGALQFSREYTSLVLIFTGIVLFLIGTIGKDVVPVNRFFYSFGIFFILFLGINSILTSMPVVIYSDDMISGLRLGTIPVEDFFYNFSMLTLHILIFEKVKTLFRRARRGKRVAVIGAGFGGLSASIRLAHEGFEVHVYEKNCDPGGKAGNLVLEGYRFDTGPSLFTMKSVFEKLFSDVGRDFNDYVKSRKMDLICRYFYEEGNVVDGYNSSEKLAREIEENTADDAGSVGDYLKRVRQMYEVGSRLFLYDNPWKIRNIFHPSFLRAIPKLWKLAPFSNVHDFNSRYFSDPKTVQLFDRYATYAGSDPYRAPAALAMIPAVEYEDGAYDPEGGIFSLTMALFRLAKEKGVVFHYNCEVEKIATERGLCRGVVVDGKLIHSDVVVSNCDVTYTYRNLIKTPVAAGKRYGKMEPSSSGIVFYWGMGKCFERLRLNNIFFSGDYRDEFNKIFMEGKVSDDPTIYINITSKTNPDDAPEGCENWFVLVNAPYAVGQKMEKTVRRVRKNTIDKLERILGEEIESNIVVESILTPKILEKKFFANRGAIYGISSNSRMSAFFRQKQRSTDFRGLYFCGGSAHPGGGMPLCVLSGIMAAEEVLRNELEK